MLKALLLSLALLAPIPVAAYALVGSPGASFEKAASPEPQPVSYTPAPLPHARSTIEIDASAMPGPTGWFVVPVTADRDTYVDVRAKAKAFTDGSGKVSGFGIIVAMPDMPSPALFSFVQNAWRNLAINHEGNVIACCENPGEFEWWSGGYARTSAGHGGTVGPDRSLYVGLAATHWTKDSKLKITIESYDATLKVGEALTGERVEAIDLVQAAYDQGTNVQFGGNTVTGKAGALDRAWKAENAGLIALNYFMSGRGTGQLRLELPGGRVIDNGEGVDVAGFAMGATDPGEIRLAFKNVNAPSYFLYNPITHSTSDDPGWIHATVLFADVKIPQRGIEAFQHDVEYEDEDW